jgi:signal transduction histidine kinase/CheY-like chemotaxis protein
MAAHESSPRFSEPTSRVVWLEPLRDATIWVVLAGLYIAGLLLAGSSGAFRQSAQHVWLSLLTFLLAGLVVLLRRWNRSAAAWLLAIGCFATVLLAVTWGGVDAAIWLLLVPVGITALAIGIPWGVATAVACSLAIGFVPSTLLSVSQASRAITLIGIWTTIGLIWAAVHPLLAALRWAWSSYESNRLILEQARDNQVRLYETMEDLASANLQLSRLNRLAQALRQAAEDERTAKEQFVANVSHELRTPLNMIIGFCEMITSAPEAYGDRVPPTLLSDLNVVLRNSQHLSSLIDDVLDLSQIEAGQMALTKERVSLSEIVQSATVAVRPLFESKGLDLESDIPQDLPLVSCDRTRIREVVLNLLSNAGRFTEQGGVQVRAWQKGSDVVVSVRDTGPGIAAEHRDRLFLPFQQLDGSVRRRYGGTGLGLSISRSFVELHEGRMWVESEVGRGTTFSFSLPIDPPTPLDSGALRWFNPYEPYEGRTRPSRLEPAQDRPRLVVVESGDSMQRLLTRYLDHVEIATSPDLEQALAELPQSPAQALLINDIHIGDALQQINNAQALPYATPAIVCAIPGKEQAAGELGVFDYLVKPISREALLSCLDRVDGKVSTVLLVDDEPDALRLFGRMLNEADRGYRVVRASSGRQALEILRQDRPDVMLLDLVMPEMDGFQLLSIKSQDPELRDIPVILISARDPLGQPIVSNGLAVTCQRGMSAREVLACIDALSRILSRATLPLDRALTTAPLD